MRKVEELKAGEVLLVDAKKVNGGKVQLQFAEIIKSGASRPQGLVGLLNKSDDRFTQTGKARRSWVAGEIADIKAAFGVDLSELTDAPVGTIKELNILNPMYGSEELHIQITETTEPDNYQAANIEKTAKKAGADGDFLYYGGKHIFSNSTIVAGKAEHVFLKADAAGAAPDTSIEDAVQDAMNG